LTKRIALIAAVILAVEFWVLFSDVHFLWRPPEPPSGRIVIATLGDGSRNVKVRSPNQLNWRVARNGEALLEGDEVVTLDSGIANLALDDGQVIKLGANSLLVLRQARLLSTRSYTLSLLKGSLQRGVEPPVAASAGNIEIEVRPKTLQASPGAVPAPTNAAHPALRAAELRLLSPPVGALLMDPETVTLAWAPPLGDAARALALNGEYVIEVAADESFSKLVMSEKAGASARAQFHPPRKGKYFWRVVAPGGQGSSHGTFEVAYSLAKPKLMRPEIQDKPEAAPSPKLDAPVLQKPSIRYKGGSHSIGRFGTLARLAASILGGPQAYAEGRLPASDTPYVVRLTWQPVRGAQVYQLQISPEPTFRQPVAEKFLTEPSYLWRTDVAGLYYWRVAAVDADGDRGPFSEYNSFTILAERNKPGEERTYDTYLRFDEYARREQLFRLLTGPSFNYYKYRPGDSSDSPSAVDYSSTSWRHFQMEYDNRVDPHYSIQGMVRSDVKTLDSGNFVDRTRQHKFPVNETTFSLGFERRYFRPRDYFSISPALRFTFIDLPVRESDTQLNVHTFSFFGVQFLGGYDRELGSGFSLMARLGPVVQYTESSLRYGAMTQLGVSRLINATLSVGIRVDYDLRLYAFGADSLDGLATSHSLQPFVFFQFNF
jgi:hypothetical protein